MRVTLQKVTTVDVEVELPEPCPKCGRDFHGTDDYPYPLIEDQYSAESQICGLDGDDMEYGEAEGCDDGGGAIVTGYRCGHCREVIVTTEGT